MDLPEIHIVRRALADQKLDPVVALGLLVKVLTDDHIEHCSDAWNQREGEEAAGGPEAREAT